MSTTLATDRGAAPSLAKLKEAAMIRKAPQGLCVLVPCACPPRSPETGWADEKDREKCPLCRGKGAVKVALKPHPPNVDAAIRCPKCKVIMVAEETAAPIQASGRVLALGKPIDYWLCVRCRRHYDAAAVRGKVIANCPRELFSPISLYMFLLRRAKVMSRLGLKESAIAKE